MVARLTPHTMDFAERAAEAACKNAKTQTAEMLVSMQLALEQAFIDGAIWCNRELAEKYKQGGKE